MLQRLRCILFAVVALCNAWTANAQASQRDSARYRSYIKLSLLPVVSAIQVKAFRLGLQFDHQIKTGKKFSFNISVDYVHNTNSEILLRPGIQYYFGKQMFKGFYTGVYPLFYGINYDYGKSRYLGGGLLAGYRFFIFKKLSLEINASFNAYTGTRPVFDQYGNVHNEAYSQSFPYAEIVVGFPLGKKR